jgi:ubiquinone/menaquinone biosynthesis C-methylase UbiE
MPYEDKFFDAICATEIIEHSYDPPLLFKELKRVLKDDGIIFTTVPIEAPPKDVGHVIFFPHPVVFQQYAAENGFASQIFDLNLYPPNDEGKLWLQGCGFLLQKIKEGK